MRFGSYCLGRIGTTRFLWNEKEWIDLQAKTFQDAVKEAEAIVKEKSLKKEKDDSRV